MSSLGFPHDKILSKRQIGHNKLYLGLSAAISSVLTNVFMTPLDTIRARYQLSTKKLSVKDVIKELWSNEGYKGFYKGLINIFLMHAGLHSWPEKCSIMSWKYLGKNMLGSHSRFLNAVKPVVVFSSP